MPSVRTQICITLSIVAVAVAAVSAAAAGAATPTTHTLTVKIAGTGSGVIRGGNVDCAAGDGKPVGPCTVTEMAGNHVTLTASGGPGSVFAGWSGDGCSGTGSCSVTLSADVTVTARFTQSTVSARTSPMSVSNSRRTVSLPMTCKGPGSCVGSVQLTAKPQGAAVTLASAGYNIAKGRTTDVRLRVSGDGIALLKANHDRLRATLSIRPNGGTVKNTRLTVKLSG